MYPSIEKYFYGKPKYSTLKERTIKRIEVLRVVWEFSTEERVVGRLGALLWFFFFLFQYDNREVSDKFKNTKYNHQDSEGG